MQQTTLAQTAIPQTARQQAVRHTLWIVLAAGLAFFTNLGLPYLWDEDEPKNAACAREMLERHDWVVPRFNYDLRTAKPVLMYWFVMSAYEVFGINELGARFWSALFGLGTALLTYHIGRRLFRPEVGLWAALALIGSLMFCVASRACTPDAPLIFFSSLALAIFAEGLARRLGDCARTGAPYPTVTACLPTNWLTFVALYAAMGVAVLAKGPVGVVLPTGILCLFAFCLHVSQQACVEVDGKPLTWRRRLWNTLMPGTLLRIIWQLRPLTAVAVVGAIAIPWYVWVGVRTEGAWLEGFLGTHNVGRFMKPMEGHSGSAFYYLVAVLAGMFPWSVFLPLSVVQLQQRLRSTTAWNPADLFVACWAGAYLGFFTLASTKLPSYVLPAYPALALLTARCIDGWLTGAAIAPRHLLRTAFGILAVAGAGCCIGIPLATRAYLPGQAALGLIGLIPLTGGLAALWFVEHERRRSAATAFAATAVLFATGLFGFVAVRINPFQTSPAIMGLIHTQSPDHAEIATFGYFQPSLAFYAKQPVVKIRTPEKVGEFFRTTPDAYLLIRDHNLATLQPALPADVEVIARKPHFLRRGEVLVLGRKPVDVAGASMKSRL